MEEEAGADGWRESWRAGEREGPPPPPPPLRRSTCQEPESLEFWNSLRFFDFLGVFGNFWNSRRFLEFLLRSIAFKKIVTFYCV